MDYVSQIPKSCSTCFFDPLARPPAQHTALATQTGCFAVLSSVPGRGCAGSRCLTLPFKWHCLLPAASTQGGKAKPKAKAGPAGQRGHSPAAHVHRARAQHPPHRAAMSLSGVTQAQKGCPPPATCPPLLSDTDGQFGRTVCTYAEMLSCPLTPHPSIMVDL